MHLISEQNLDAGVTERRFNLGDTSGILWTPPTATSSAPVPVILMGQPGGIGMHTMYPRIATRARGYAAQGFAAVSIELPGAGNRAPLPGVEQARAELRHVVTLGGQPEEEIIARLILPLVEQAVPEWQTTIDELLGLPELSERIGFSGGVPAIGVHLAAIEPRVVAAGLFAGSYVPRQTMVEARKVAIPLHVVLQWDDEDNDRQMALDLFDAFASTEKTLYANMGGHTGVPQFAVDDSARFFARHLI